MVCRMCCWYTVRKEPEVVRIEQYSLVVVGVCCKSRSTAVVTQGEKAYGTARHGLEVAVERCRGDDGGEKLK